MSAYSQTFVIEGHLADTSLKILKENAVISILKQKDSTLLKFTRSDVKGYFRLAGLPPGNLILLVTFPGYADYVELFELGNGPVHNFNSIPLSKKATLLEEIIVRQTPIHIKGDTTEYKADSFILKPNASVEDLLKELHGIQVDKNGRITAQGKTVEKILIDGEEFFSDDPTVVTRNIRADAVEKIQVFDKKSDQSSFTGIDDGQSTKTINLELKEDARKGYFGKLSAAALDQYYNTQGFINSFKGKRKLSAFVIAGNTEKTGLDMNESNKYGFENDNIRIDEGSGTIFISSEGGDDLGIQNYAGEGLPESVKGGLHFSNKWKNDILGFNGNYLFSNLTEYTVANTFRKNVLKDSVYYTRENLNQYSDKLRHSLSGVFEGQLDSSSSIKITAEGYTGTFENMNKFKSETFTADETLANTSDRHLVNKADNSTLNALALYRKKFKKEGRTFSLNMHTMLKQADNKVYLQDESYFPGSYVQGALRTDQHKKINSNQNIFSGKMTFTEGLTKKSYLEFNYSFTNNKSTTNRLSYDKDPDNKYSILIDSLSNHFDYRINTNSIGINYRINEKKYYFSFGGDITATQFRQTDRIEDTKYLYNYTNFFPQAVFNYKFNPYTNLNVKYTGISQQPDIHQLQPVKNNSDPLNIFVGNPHLKPEFENTIQIGYTNYKVLTERYILLSGFVVQTSNMITSGYNVDDLGRRVIQAVNTEDGFATALGGGYSIKIPNTIARLTLGPSLNYSKYANYINGLKNISRSTTILFRLNTKISRRDKYDFYGTVTPSVNSSASSISEVYSVKYTNYNFDAGGSVTLPAKFESGADITVNLREKLDQYDVNNNVILINAYVEKKFLKNEMLSLRVSINDILDQNKGYDRIMNPQYSQERTYLTFRRYGLIGLTYHFVNKGGKLSTEDGTIRL